jgi:hypothetical protein
MAPALCGSRSSKNGAIRFSGAPELGSGWLKNHVPPLAKALVKLSQPLVETWIESKKVP